jgi:hypothetical protein
MAFGLKPGAAIGPGLVIARKIGQSVISASAIQVRSAAAIQNGTGTVLT